MTENPGKFGSDLDAVIHSLSLDGPDEEVGDVQDFGWYGLLADLTEEELHRGAKDTGIAYDEGIAEAVGKSAIIHEDSQGFVTITLYDSADEADEVWADIEADADEFYEGAGEE